MSRTACINPWSGTCMYVAIRKFHMIFLWYPQNFHFINPPVWIFLEQPNINEMRKDMSIQYLYISLGNCRIQQHCVIRQCLLYVIFDNVKFSITASKLFHRVFLLANFKTVSGHISKCSFGNGHSFDTQNLFHSQKLFLLINKVATF